MKRKNEEDQSFNKEPKLTIQTDNLTDNRILLEQKNNLLKKCNEQKNEIQDLSGKIEKLQKENEKINTTVGIIQRFWNNVSF